jgi:hypothetical protein
LRVTAVGGLRSNALAGDEAHAVLQNAQHHVLRIRAVRGAEEDLIDRDDVERRPGSPGVQHHRSEEGDDEEPRCSAHGHTPPIANLS